MEKMKLRKNHRSDQIWWVDTPDKDGGMDFTFDKITFYNAFRDYPHALTPQQKAIFDKENPFWADFFKDRM